MGRAAGGKHFPTQSACFQASHRRDASPGQGRGRAPNSRHGYELQIGIYTDAAKRFPAGRPKSEGVRGKAGHSASSRQAPMVPFLGRLGPCWHPEKTRGAFTVGGTQGDPHFFCFLPMWDHSSWGRGMARAPPRAQTVHLFACPLV